MHRHACELCHWVFDNVERLGACSLWCVKCPYINTCARYAFTYPHAQYASRFTSVNRFHLEGLGLSNHSTKTKTKKNQEKPLQSSLWLPSLLPLLLLLLQQLLLFYKQRAYSLLRKTFFPWLFSLFLLSRLFNIMLILWEKKRSNESRGQLYKSFSFRAVSIIFTNTLISVWSNFWRQFGDSRTTRDNNFLSCTERCLHPIPWNYNSMVDEPQWMMLTRFLLSFRISCEMFECFIFFFEKCN